MAGKTKRAKRTETPPVAARVAEPTPPPAQDASEVPPLSEELRAALVRSDAKFAGMYRRLAE